MRIYFYPKKTYAVSVIIPLYNAEKYIGECLDSLLAQTFQNFEVIVVDDCSTDNSAKIVESYAPKFNRRLILTIMEKNTGSGGLPRNKGLSFSCGEYIQFLDADDMLTKTALEEMYLLAKEYGADVVNCEKFYYVDDDGTNIRIQSNQKGKFVDKPLLESEDLEKRVQNIIDARYLTTTCNKFVRQNLITENEIFFPNLKTSEDNIWTQGLLFYGKKILRVPNVVYVYRQSEGSSQRANRTPSKKINFWLNPVLLGLKYLDELMGRHEFFKENLSCRFALLKNFVNVRLDITGRASQGIDEHVIYSAIKNEFSEKLGEYDVIIPTLCVALCSKKIDSKKELEIINRLFTARIDFKLVPKIEGDFKVLSVSDDKALVRRAGWLPKNEIGYFVQSYAGKVEIITKATADGRFSLKLLGIWVPTPEDRNKRIPYWIDYTSLTVNGKKIFDKVIPVWHDKPYHYNLDVKAGEEIRIKTEWLPHRDERFNVPTLAPTIQTEPTIDKKFLPYLTSRLDVRMMSEGNLQIISTSDDKAAVKKAAWLPKNESGYFIQSYVGKMEVVAKASADSQIQLSLKGMDIRHPDDKSKRIPYWIDYTKLTVNGKVIFDELTPAWHDKPYSYALDVKAGEEIKIQTEWLPHKDNRFDVSSAAVTTQETPKEDDKEIQELKEHSTARIDVRLKPTEQGDFQILSVSDDKAKVKKATWLAANEIGYFVQSYIGKMEVVAKVIGGGHFNLDLRGMDIRDPKDKSKRIPYWIDYTKLAVNGEVLFDKLTPVWHDKPYRYNVETQDGDEIIISVEWQPHRSDT